MNNIEYYGKAEAIHPRRIVSLLMRHRDVLTFKPYKDGMKCDGGAHMEDGRIITRPIQIKKRAIIMAPNHSAGRGNWIIGNLTPKSAKQFKREQEMRNLQSSMDKKGQRYNQAGLNELV